MSTEEEIEQLKKRPKVSKGSQRGFFQINDVVLSIPPSQIQVGKMNHANKVANLRTSSEATIWSRNKEVHVNVKMFFTDKPEKDGTTGLTDLIKIIAGLRVSPFCYIENEFIRDSILGVGKKRTMAFAMRSMNISTASNAQTSTYMPGTISVELDLSYFNYNSYVSEFKYRFAPFSHIIKDEPSESVSWLIMRKAEQRRRNYTDIKSFTHETRPIWKTSFEFSEFKLVGLVALMNKLKEKQKKLGLKRQKELELKRMKETSESHYGSRESDPDHPNQSYDYSMDYDEIIRRDEKNSSHPNDVSSYIDTGTSMIPKKDKKPISVEEMLLSQEVNSFSRDGEWKLYKMRDGSLYNLKKNPFKGVRSRKDVSSDVKNDDLFLVTRLLKMSLAHTGLHILGININFTNRVTPISLLGSEAPTFQYLGGNDASVSMSLKTTNNSALKAIVSLERVWQSQTNRMRVLPLKLRRIKISNDLLNMCGLHNFLMNNINISTSPGEPDCRYIHLDLSEKEFDGTDESFTYEKFDHHPKDKIFEMLLPVFNKNLDFIKNQMSTDLLSNRISYKWRTGRKGGVGYLKRKVLGGGPISVGKNKGKEHRIEEKESMGSYASSYSLLSNILPSLISANYGYGTKSHYKEEKIYDRLYKPRVRSNRDITNSVYMEIMNGYSIILSDFVKGLVDYLQVTEASLNVFGLRGKGDSVRPGRVFSHENFSGSGYMTDYYNIFKDKSAWSAFSPEDRLRFSINLEYKRWHFLDNLKDKKIFGIQKAKKDAFSILTNQDVNPKGANYYTKLRSGKVNKVHFNSFETKIFDLPYNAHEYEDLDGSYEEEAMWGDFSSQEFFIEFVGRRASLLSFLAENEEYLKIIAEVIPSIKGALEEMRDEEVVSGNGSYPDFPMDEVIDIIGEGYQSSLERFQEVIKETNKSLNGRFLSLPRLFGPDFYFHDESESLDTILGKEKLKVAASLVSQSASSKPSAINDWLKKTHKRRIGQEEWEYAENNRRELGRKDVDVALKKGFLEDEDVKKLRDDEMYRYYMPSDYGKGFNCGLENHEVQSYDGEEMTPDIVIENPSTIQGITDLKGKVAFSREELDSSGVPDFEWPISGGYRITSPFGPRKGYGGGSHNGVDMVGSLFIKAAADGFIYHMSPGNKNVKRFKKTWTGSGRSLGGGGWKKTAIIFTWKDHFQKQTKYNLDNELELKKFRKDKGYSEHLWNRLNKKEYIPTHIIRIKHKEDGKWITEYKHMENDDVWNILYKKFINSGKRLEIKKGDIIGTMGSTGFSTGVHLHFSLKHKGGYEDPEKIIIYKNFKKLLKPKFDFTRSHSVLQNTYNKFEKSAQESRGMIRAYPTFKLYFIESDAGNSSLYGFDDFFAYQAVQEIQVVRNADNPVDLCIIRLTNLSGNLTNKKFMDLKQNIGDPNSKKNRDKPSAGSPIAGQVKAKESIENSARGNIDNEKENPISSLLLKSGTQIQLRMGYDPNPSELPIVFNGAVMDIQYHGSDETMTITCQSYAMELATNLQGVENPEGSKEDLKKTKWEGQKEGSSGNIIETLMTYPELKHFGRWQVMDSTGFAYLADEKAMGGQEAGSSLVYKPYKLKKAIYNDNIFVSKGGLSKLTENSPFTIYKSTIWDIVQELSYRHPGVIAYPVPYRSNQGPAMTLFFGLPDGNYVAKDPSKRQEKAASKLRYLLSESYLTKSGAQRARDFIKRMTDGSLDPDSSFGFEGASSVKFEEESSVFGDDKSIARDYVISKKLRKFALDEGIIQSFRSYHIISDTHNLIENSIISSAYSTFNSATIEYSSSSTGADLDEDEAELKFGSAKTLTLKADSGIRSEEIREVYAGFPNCFGVEQAKRYGQSLLWRSMKQGYRGSLVILGDANIKPYDICYVFDSFTETYGPVEVEQVVHRFSHQSGFITEIVPRMCISTNEEASMATLDVMGLVAEDKGYSKSFRFIDPDFGDSTVANIAEDAAVLAAQATVGVAGVGLVSSGLGMVTTGSVGTILAGGLAGVAAGGLLVVGGVVLAGIAAVGMFNYIFLDNILLEGSEEGTGPLDATGLATFRKSITRTQMQHLFEYSPLSVRGRPLLGGLPIHKKSWGPGTFIQSFIQGKQEYFEEGMRGEGYFQLDQDKLNNPELHPGK